MKTKDEKQLPDSEVTKTQLLELLNEGKTLKVLEICKPIGSMYEMLEAQLKNVEKDFELGLIDYATMEISRNRIKFAARNSIERLPDGAIDFHYWKPVRMKPDLEAENNKNILKAPFWKQVWKNIMR